MNITIEPPTDTSNIVIEECNEEGIHTSSIFKPNNVNESLDNVEISEEHIKINNPSLNIIDYETISTLLTIFGYIPKPSGENDTFQPKDFVGITFPRERLSDSTYMDSIKDLIPILRIKYNSGKLTCLHKNAEDKQKYPNLNLLRQILKMNGYKLRPIIRCAGYSGNGQKITFREFRIEFSK
jgi:hypothetical protein